ncbi:uncharacterized protein K460DRAFT_426406, partial [Cucurbitaria berberidis CBS 394.84]
MRLLLSFFVLLFVVAANLPLVFGEQFCGTDSNATLVEADLFGPQMGAASFLKGEFRHPWPQVGNRRPIRYCYVDEATRNELHCSVQGGLGAWALKVEGPIKENGHSLSWQTAGDRTNDMTRYYTQILSRRFGEVEPCRKSGHSRYTWEEGRNANGILAHEIGHVLGMVHEQVRYDRNDHVEYRCHNVLGYQRALSDAILAGVSADMAGKDLCEDMLFAQRFAFDGTAFTKQDKYKSVSFAILGDGDFDYPSIMLYPSNTYAGPGCQGTVNNLVACTLVAIDRANGNAVGQSYIHTNMVPSAGDVAFVRKYYP